MPLSYGKVLLLLSMSVCTTANAYQIVENVTVSTQQVTQSADSVTNTPTFIRHEYSTRPAFNADGSMAIMYSSNGYYHLYQVNTDGTLAYLHALDQINSPGIEPNWHPTDPNIIYAFNILGIGMQIQRYNVTNQSQVDTIDMSADIQALGGSFATADRANTGEEGRPSGDGNTWCLAVYSGDSWQMQGIVAYDISLGQVIAARETTQEIDSIKTSVNGNYCVTNGFSGIYSYDTSDSQFNTVRQIHQGPEHIDVALDANQRDVVIYVDSINDGNVKAVDLDTGNSVNLFSTWNGVSVPAMHFSGLGYDQPGWAMVSSFLGDSTSFYHNKLMAVELTDDPRVVLLGDTQHSGQTNGNFWAQPHAVASYQLDKVLFSSDASGEVADYMTIIDQPLPAARGILEPAPLRITSDDTMYIQQEGNHDVVVQTNNNAQCRWDYYDGNSYPFIVLYQDLTTTDNLTHSFNTFFWGNIEIYVVCQGDGGSEVEQVVQIVLDGSAPPADTTAPVFAANLRTSAVNNTAVTLEWDAATDNVAIDGYRIMRSSNGGAFTEVANVTELSFNNTGLLANNAYTYQVFAYDAAGNETSSNILDVTTTDVMSAIDDTFGTAYETVLNADVSSNDNESTTSPATWELVSAPAEGSLVLNDDGSFSYTPAGEFSGVSSFTYHMRDAAGIFSNTATASITVGPQPGVSACDALYAAQGGYIPVTHRSVIPVTSVPKPAKGVHSIDTDFNTCVARVSNHANDSDNIVGRAVPVYSRRQVFNADNSRILLSAGDGELHLYDSADYTHIRRVQLQGGSEFQWHPTNPNWLYRMDVNGGMQIYLHDISNPDDSVFSVAVDFTNVASIDGYPGFTSVTQVWPGATRLSTAEEGAPSADGRYWAFNVFHYEEATTEETGYGMIVYDMQTNAIVGAYDYATDGGGIGSPNNVSMSPSGSHVVAIWAPPACDGVDGRPVGRGVLNNPCGTMSFNKQFTQATGLVVQGSHGDTATDENGRDVYVGIEYTDRGAIEIIDLETGYLINDLETQVWNGSLHVSGRAYNKPGWVAISHYTTSQNNDWYENEVFLAKLDGSSTIVRLAKHHSDVTVIDDSGEDYWRQPHATISRDGTRVIWGSNWDNNNRDLDSYMITLPVDALDNL